MKHALRRPPTSPHGRLWAVLLALLLGACGGAEDAAAPTVMAPLLQQVSGPSGTAALAPAPDEAPEHSARAQAGDTVYSIINLGNEAGLSAVLNARGQAVFSNLGNAGIYNGFFDGERVHDIGSLGGGYTMSRGLNDHGVVVGESEDDNYPHSHIRAVTWSVAEGMRALQGDYLAQGRAINNVRQVVGYAQADGLSAQAARWNAGGALHLLGPRPESLSQANAINQDGLAAGFADQASGAIHAVRWNADGSQADLGTLGGSLAFAEHINARGQVAGVSDAADGRLLAFFWSARGGMLPVGAEGGGTRLVAALNDRGDIAGNTQEGDLSKPYLWTRRRGLTLLPLAGVAQGDLFALNAHGQMVGALQAGPDWRYNRAVRWPGLAKPIDLNTRLHRPPSGLHLYAGAAINDDGLILAHSNAGLVLLRPGKRGSNAPVLGPLQGLPDTVALGASLSLKLAFTDNNPRESHQASIDWGDGCAAPAPVVRESRGVGTASVQHTFCAPGLYAITVRVSDSGGRATVLRRDVYVADPAQPALAGRGTLAAGGAAAGSPGGARPLQFSLWAPLADGAPQPQGSARAPFVQLAGPFHFKSMSVERIVRDGRLVRIEGDGSHNGRPGYRFLIDALDEGAADRMRVRITHRDASSGTEVLDYDSAAAAARGSRGGAALRFGEASAGEPVLDGGITLRD